MKQGSRNVEKCEIQGQTVALGNHKLVLKTRGCMEVNGMDVKTRSYDLKNHQRILSNKKIYRGIRIWRRTQSWLI